MLKFNLFIILIITNGCANYVSNMHQEFDSYEQRKNRQIQSTPSLESVAEGDKRYIADDFQDQGDGASLWVGNGKENFFSSGGVRKEKGDLVTINVYGKLKNKITAELTRYYPAENTQEKENKVSKKPGNTSKSQEDIQDKISVVVSKEVRENHLILTGRKQIIFNENRHLIEVQALVHRKDISSDDSLDSSKIIQSTIKVLR